MPPTIASAPDPERGARIQTLRLALDLNQKTLGEMVGVSQSAVSLWERGGRIERAHLVALAGALQTTLRHITKGEDDRGARSASVGVTSLALERVERRQEALDKRLNDVQEQLAAIRALLEEIVLRLPLGSEAVDAEDAPLPHSAPASDPPADG